jgi:hypothetical protein
MRTLLNENLYGFTLPFVLVGKLKTGDVCFEQKCMSVQFQFKFLACFTYIQSLLQADEPTDDPSQIDEYISTTTVEEGFKGE